MLLSYAQLIAILSVLSVASVAGEDVSSGKNSEVDAKWFGGWRTGAFFNSLGSYGYLNLNSWNLGNNWGGGLYNYGWPASIYGCANYYGGFPSYWLKAAEGQHERRSVDSRAQPTLSKRDQAPVQCKNKEGHLESFTPEHCLKAASKLASHQASSANCGSCSLSIVGPDGKLAAAAIPASELHTAAQNILKACGSSTSASQHAKRYPADSANNAKPSFVVLLSKGNGAACS